MITLNPNRNYRLFSGAASLAAALGALSGSMPSVAAARVPAPPDSYLHYKVYTVDGLVSEIQSDPAIRAHYARTFHVAPNHVVQYIRNNVVESYIQQTGNYTVYCVRPNGYIYPTKQRFRRGTKVFALRNGDPVMKWACGNPLLSFLPAVHEKVVPVVKTITKVSPSVETLIPAQSPAEVVPVEEVAPVYQPRVPILAAPTAATGTLISGVARGPGILPFLPIAILPALGGHGSTPSTTGGGTTTGTTAGTTTGTTSGTTTGTTSGTTTGTTSGTTTGTTSGTTTGTTSGTTTGTTSTTTGTTTAGSVPEASSSSTVGVGFAVLALAALMASMKKSAPTAAPAADAPAQDLSRPS